MRLVAMISANGRDGHMFAVPATGNDGPILPLRIYEFRMVFTSPLPMAGYETLAGTRLVAVGSHPIDEILHGRRVTGRAPRSRVRARVSPDIRPALGCSAWPGPHRRWTHPGDGAGGGRQRPAHPRPRWRNDRRVQRRGGAGGGWLHLPARSDTWHPSDLDTVSGPATWATAKPCMCATRRCNGHLPTTWRRRPTRVARRCGAHRPGPASEPRRG